MQLSMAQFKTIVKITAHCNLRSWKIHNAPLPMKRHASEAIEIFSEDFEGTQESLVMDSSRKFKYVQLGVIALVGVTFFLISVITLVNVNKTGTATKAIYANLQAIEKNSPTSTPTPPSPQQLCAATSIADEDRVDCHPDNSASAESCAERGCCFNDTRINTNVPVCFFPDGHTGYSVVRIDEGPAKTTIELERQRPSGFPRDVDNVLVEVSAIDDNKVRIRMSDPTTNRWETTLPPLHNAPVLLTSPLYKIYATEDGILKINRLSTGTVVVHMDLKRLVFAEQFLQVTNRVPSNQLFGLGEHKAPFRKEITWKKYTMLNSDRPPEEDAPLYGTHPFYMMIEDDEANSHGFLLFNTNIMDVITTPSPTVTFRTIGGLLDFYVYLGPSPIDVISQHAHLVGRAPMPPLWGLGFHLCRYGYNSDTVTRATWQRTRDSEIPFDVQWNDIDYMTNNNDFTYDKVNYAGLPQLVADIHAANMRWVPIIDPAVSESEPRGQYVPYDLGEAMDIFIKDTSGEKDFVGKVWNSQTSVWPDFTNPQATVYWTKMIKDFSEEVGGLDGIWIDMNEPSNVYDGMEGGCPANDLESPPYVPGAPLQQLQHKTLCMSASHYASSHYDVHNLYAIYEAKATREALMAIRGSKRPFIISRATSTGFGAYASHWTGDIWSSWDNMKFTIPAMINFNMLGIPLVGSDICGFIGNTTEELCARWSALGAFYPFSRNHNGLDYIEQDPVALGPNVTAAAKNALELRYSLLPYLYTLFYRAAAFGEPVARSVMFEFPKDKDAYKVEDQFMWGSNLLISPVLEQGALTVEAYFPAGKWFDYETKVLIVDSKSETKVLQVPLDKISVAVRGGSVLATQQPGLNTAEQRKNPFELLVTLDGNGEARGELFWDDGDDMYSTMKMEYSLLAFTAKDNALTVTPLVSNYKDGNFILSKVTVLGLSGRPKEVLISVGNVTQSAEYSYDNDILTILKLTSDLNVNLFATWKM